jgi:hypothetical protein
VFTEPLFRNGLHNPVVLYLRALPGNGRCLQSHLLATGPHTTVLLSIRNEHNGLTLAYQLPQNISLRESMYILPVSLVVGEQANFYLMNFQETKNSYF